MQWTGNVARTLGHILVALGTVALVLGVAGLVIGALMVKDASNGARPADGAGEVLKGLVLGGISLVAGGVLALVAGIVCLGVSRSLRGRLERRLASSASPVGKSAS
jgi:hypothetical protein